MDPQGRWLLQRRAASKALFGGCWANTCCTHPAPGEEPLQAVIRRVREELGVTLATATSAGVFTYRAVDPRSGLVEHEQDHVYAAIIPFDAVTANGDEIDELVALPFGEALVRVGSTGGAPWAPEVLRRAFNVLSEPALTGAHLAELLAMIDEGTVSTALVSEALAGVLAGGDSPRQVVAQRGGVSPGGKERR